MKISIGVDLHKSQFTVCFLAEGQRMLGTGIYPTNEIGYEEFLSKCSEYGEQGFELNAAVESTVVGYIRSHRVDTELRCYPASPAGRGRTGSCIFTFIIDTVII